MSNLEQQCAVHVIALTTLSWCDGRNKNLLQVADLIGGGYRRYLESGLSIDNFLFSEGANVRQLLDYLEVDSLEEWIQSLPDDKPDLYEIPD